MADGGARGSSEAFVGQQSGGTLVSGWSRVELGLGTLLAEDAAFSESRQEAEPTNSNDPCCCQCPL